MQTGMLPKNDILTTRTSLETAELKNNQPSP
jgi:hypothetical protein